MIQDFIAPFLTILFSELGDKTQIAIICLSSKTKKHCQLFCGVMLAFALVDGIAILLGNFISLYIPLIYIKIFSGILFVAFGIHNLIKNKDEDSECEVKNPFFSGFIVISLSELGDKTHIASSIFATNFNPLIVFLSVLFALFIISTLSIFSGKFLGRKIKRENIIKISSIIFILLGIYFILTSKI